MRKPTPEERLLRALLTKSRLAERGGSMYSWAERHSRTPEAKLYHELLEKTSNSEKVLRERLSEDLQHHDRTEWPIWCRVADKIGDIMFFIWSHWIRRPVR